MAHHKRGRPKSSRAGCLMCKSHKRNGCYQPMPFEIRASDRMDASEAELLLDGNGDVPVEEHDLDDDYGPDGQRKHWVSGTDRDERLAEGRFPSVHEEAKVTLGDLMRRK